MTTIHRGYEIYVTCEKSLGGDRLMYYSIFRVSDDYECDSGFESSSETVLSMTENLKARVDAELQLLDPWGEEEIRLLDK